MWTDCAILDSVKIIIPDASAQAKPDDLIHEVCGYEQMFKASVRLSFPPEVWELLSKLRLAPSQIKPNA